MALERAEAHIARLEHKLEALRHAIEEAGYRVHEANRPGAPVPLFILEPVDPGPLIQASLEAWEAGLEAGAWS